MSMWNLIQFYDNITLSEAGPQPVIKMTPTCVCKSDEEKIHAFSLGLILYPSFSLN